MYFNLNIFLKIVEFKYIIDCSLVFTLVVKTKLLTAHTFLSPISQDFRFSFRNVSKIHEAQSEKQHRGNFHLFVRRGQSL